MQEQDKTLDKSWATDRLLAKEDKLTSPIWEEVKDEDRLFNLPLGDAIYERARFLLIPLTKVARAYKDIFATTLLSAYINSVNEDDVIAGSLLDKAYALLELPMRVRPKITGQLQSMMSGESTPWISSLDEITDEDYDWLSEDWLAKGIVHQIQGAGGVGKSFLAGDIVANISSGGKVFGQDVEPAKVLYLSSEDSPSKVIKQRIKSMGGNSKNVFVLNGLKLPKFPSSIAELYTWVVKYKPALIVIDPILSMYEGDMNSNTGVREALNPLVQLADYFNCAIIYINHTGKSQKSNSNHKALGSSAFTDLSRFNFEVAKDEDTGERIITCIKSNNGSKMLSWSYEIVEHEGFKAGRIKHNGLTEVRADQLGVELALVDEIKNEIFDYLTDNGETEGKALTEYFRNIDTSSSMRTFQEARAYLVKAGKIEKSKKSDNKYYYQITGVSYVDTTSQDVKM